MVAVPAPTIVTVFPLSVTTEGVRLVNVTGDPELAVALMANGSSPWVCSAIGSKVIVWVPRMIRVVLAVSLAPAVSVMRQRVTCMSQPLKEQTAGS